MAVQFYDVLCSDLPAALLFQSHLAKCQVWACVVKYANIQYILHMQLHIVLSFYIMPCSSLTSPRVRYGSSRGGGVAQSLAVRDQVVCGRLSPHNHTTSYTTWNSVWTVQYQCVALAREVGWWHQCGRTGLLWRVMQSEQFPHCRAAGQIETYGVSLRQSPLYDFLQDTCLHTF